MLKNRALYVIYTHSNQLISFWNFAQNKQFESEFEYKLLVIIYIKYDITSGFCFSCSRLEICSDISKTILYKVSENREIHSQKKGFSNRKY